MRIFDVPIDLKKLILRWLRKDPQRRFQHLRRREGCSPHESRIVLPFPGGTRSSTRWPCTGW